MKNISVVGCGTMGNGIAHVFAQHDFKVSLIDLSEDVLANALNTIGKNLERQVQKEKITADQKNSALNNIETYTSLQDGVKHADLVVEAAT
ncbi:MAG: 3-hydroxyacyl-CoA dehydrogenase NAD-binding domain-containing protein, partial [Bacteroidota bacterium]